MWMLIDVMFRILANNFQALVNCKIRIPQVSFFKKWLYKLTKPTESDHFTKRFFTFTPMAYIFLQYSYFSVLKRFDLETAFRDTSIVLLQKV